MHVYHKVILECPCSIVAFLPFQYEREPLEEGGGGSFKRGGRNKIMSLVSRVFVEAFTLNVLAEWGDRSQIATVLMAAREVT